jgi:hypothetical protein
MEKNNIMHLNEPELGFDACGLHAVYFPSMCEWMNKYAKRRESEGTFSVRLFYFIPVFEHTRSFFNSIQGIHFELKF